MPKSKYVESSIEFLHETEEWVFRAYAGCELHFKIFDTWEQVSHYSAAFDEVSHQLDKIPVNTIVDWFNAFKVEEPLSFKHLIKNVSPKPL